MRPRLGKFIASRFSLGRETSSFVVKIVALFTFGIFFGGWGGSTGLKLFSKLENGLFVCSSTLVKVFVAS